MTMCSIRVYEFLRSQITHSILSGTTGKLVRSLVQREFICLISRGCTAIYIVYIFKFQCCGINGSSDWWISSQYPEPNLPPSCCTEIAANGQCEFNEITVSATGCMTKLKSTIEDKAVILGAVGIGIALVQVIHNGLHENQGWKIKREHYYFSADRSNLRVLSGSIDSSRIRDCVSLKTKQNKFLHHSLLNNHWNSHMQYAPNVHSSHFDETVRTVTRWKLSKIILSSAFYYYLVNKKKVTPHQLCTLRCFILFVCVCVCVCVCVSNALNRTEKLENVLFSKAFDVSYKLLSFTIFFQTFPLFSKCRHLQSD